MTELTTKNTTELTLSDTARRYIRKSLAPSTLRNYRTSWDEFVHYCTDSGAKHLPAHPATVIEFLTTLADAGAKVSTIDVKLAAIAWAHRAHEVTDPTVFGSVKAAMSGIRRELGSAPTKKEPATLAEITAMAATLPRTARGKRDRALLLVGFAGAFRRSELAALQVGDLRDGGDKLTIAVRRSKTDQGGKGQVKTIPQLDGDLDPVGALRAWLDVADIRSGPVFRRVDRWGNVGTAALTAQSVALTVKATAEAAGLDWRSFSGHSLRSGFITEAMDNLASDSDIMQQTGHRSGRVMRAYRKNTGAGAGRAVRAAFGATGDK